MAVARASCLLNKSISPSECIDFLNEVILDKESALERKQQTMSEMETEMSVLRRRIVEMEEAAATTVTASDVKRRKRGTP